MLDNILYICNYINICMNNLEKSWRPEREILFTVYQPGSGIQTYEEVISDADNLFIKE